MRKEEVDMTLGERSLRGYGFTTNSLRERKDKVVQLLERGLIRSAIVSQLADDSEDSVESDLNAYITLRFLPELIGEVPVFRYPDADTANGDFLIGMVHNHNQTYPFAIREQEMIRHLLFVGSTGSGKTNIALLLVKQFLRKNKPFLVVDWKRNYRDLIALTESSGREILVFTVGREVCPFHFNPLIPPTETSPHVWLAKLIEIISHAYFLGEGVAYILSKAIDSVYRDFGVYDGNGSWPSFRNVLSYLENYECKGRETQWLASALRAVAALCFGEMDRILNHGNYPIDTILDKNVILEVDALPDTAKIFLTESLLLWIHHFRMAEGKRETLKHICIIEEAHHILSRKLQIISGTETITDILLREVREFGESVIVIDQDPSLLSIPALGNTYTTICLGLKERSDISVMASALNLTGEDREILTKLEIGQAIAKLQGRWPEPFLIEVPKVEINKGSVTDQLLKDRMAWFYKELGQAQTEMRPSEEIREIITSNRKTRKQEIEPKRQIENIAKKQQEENSIETQDVNTTSQTEIENVLKELSEAERNLLIDILRNPLSKVTDRYARLGLNEYQGNKAQATLLRKELARLVMLPAYKERGYWGKTLELTEKGSKALAALGYKLPEQPSKRKGGLQHKHITKLLADRLRALGHQVQEEYPLGSGEATDLLVDGCIAIEIERSPKNTTYNVKKNLARGFQVLVVAETASLKASLKQLLVEQGLGAVAVVEVKELLSDGLRQFNPFSPVPSPSSSSPSAQNQAH